MFWLSAWVLAKKKIIEDVKYVTAHVSNIFCCLRLQAVLKHRIYSWNYWICKIYPQQLERTKTGIARLRRINFAITESGPGNNTVSIAVQNISAKWEMGGLCLSVYLSVFLHSLTSGSLQVVQSDSTRAGVPPRPGLLLHLHQLQDGAPPEVRGVLLHPQHEGHLQGGGQHGPQAGPRHQRPQEVCAGRVRVRVQRLRETHQ